MPHDHVDSGAHFGKRAGVVRHIRGEERTSLGGRPKPTPHEHLRKRPADPQRLSQLLDRSGIDWLEVDPPLGGTGRRRRNCTNWRGIYDGL